MVANLHAQELKYKKKKGLYGFYLGKTSVSGHKYDEIIDDFKDYYIVSANGKYGLINPKGEESIPCIDDTLCWNGQNTYITKRNDLFGVLDADNQLLLDFNYEAINYFYLDSTALVKLDGKWGILASDVMNYDPDVVIFKNPDQKARYTDCPEVETFEEKLNCSERKMLEFIYLNVRYPSEAREKGLEGMVVISFIVTHEGKVKNRRIMRDLAGGGCGQAALDVVRQLKDWMPAQVDGQNVSSTFYIPIRFKIK